jgi:TorA maturation chaperone TorD
METVRCWIYSRLGDVFLTSGVPRVEPPACDDDVHPRTRAAIDALCRSIARTDADELARDQVRLFVNGEGGVAAPPYASWYLDGTLLGPSTALVVEAYADQLLTAADAAGQPPDYIVTELEFLHFLCRHQEAARTTDDPLALTAVLDAETRFLQAHFFRWVPRFARAIHEADPAPVFARVADVLAAFCAEEVYLPARLTMRGWVDGTARSMDRSAHPVRSNRAPNAADAGRPTG